MANAPRDDVFIGTQEPGADIRSASNTLSAVEALSLAPVEVP